MNEITKTDNAAPKVITRQFAGKDFRIIQADNEEWFVAKDLCEILDLKRVDSAVRSLESVEKGTHALSTPGGTQSVTTVNESGFYALIFKSRKTEAREFRFKVTNEVLPSIRKTGGYNLAAQQMPLDIQEFLIEAMSQFKNEIRKELVDGINDKIVELCKPKQVAYAELKFHSITELGRLCTPILHPWEVTRILELREIVRRVAMPETGGSKYGFIPTDKALGFYTRTSSARGRKSPSGEFVPSVKWLPSVLGLKDKTDL